MPHASRRKTAYGRTFARLILCFCLTLPALAGCGSTMRTVEESVAFDFSGPVTFYKDQWARREPPLVYVHPSEKADSQLTALFMPFRVTQPISQPEIIGYSQARVVWQTWLSKRLFSIMEFDGDNGPFRRDRAIALARAKGADLAIGGFVTYYYAGGSEFESRLALQIEMYDTASGQLVWSMAQSAVMPARAINDYIVFATQTRLPADPMYALAKAIAEDTAKLLASWTPTGEDASRAIGLSGKESPKGAPAQPQHPAF